MTTLAALSLHFPFVWYGFLLLFGLALGSFYNVVIYRLPRMLTHWQGQTACWTIAIWRVRPRRRNRPAGPSITAGFRRRKR